MMNKFFDLEDLKKNIYLPELMKDNGYDPIRAKSSRGHLFMQSPDKSLVVYKNRKGHWVYFDVHTNIKQFDPHHPDKVIGATTTGQTVLDFIMMETPGTDLKQAIQIAARYKETGEFLTTDNPLFNINNRRSYHPDSLFNIMQRKFKPLGDFSANYFKSRGIDPEIIKHAPFENLFHEWAVSFKMKSARENSIGTFMATEDGKITCLLSSRIGSKTFSFGRKSESLLHTSAQLCKDKIEHFFNAESWQDILAHYEMNINKLEGKPILYTSSQGNISPQQILFIDRVVKERNPERITTIYDNDPKGIKYTCNLLNRIFLNNPYDIELSVSKKETLGFITSDIEKREFIDTMEKQFGKVSDMKISRTFEGKSQAVMTFPTADKQQELQSMAAMKQFMQGVYKLKNIPGNYSTEYSTAKDFNEDLINQKSKEQQMSLPLQ